MELLLWKDDSSGVRVSTINSNVHPSDPSMEDDLEILYQLDVCFLDRSGSLHDDIKPSTTVS